MNAHINKHMLYTKNGYEWNVCVCATNLFKAQNQALDIPLECLKPWGLERAIRHEHQILDYPYKEPQLWFVHVRIMLNSKSVIVFLTIYSY